jgi:AAA15 family ATPase/GTPase
MNDSIVRLTDISINNFKNVINGQLNFINNRKNYKTSILGLYGQNGSGKTALIDAMQLLKYAISGMAIPSKFGDYVNVDSDFATIKYIFSVTTSMGKYEAYYKFSIKKISEESSNNIYTEHNVSENFKTVVFDEVLSYSFENGNEKIRKSQLIDTRSTDVFIPESKYNCLIGKDKTKKTDLLVAKKLCYSSSKSFIFSKELLTAIRENHKDTTDFNRHIELLEALVFYGNFELFVINTTNSGMISLNALPLSYQYEKDNINSVGSMMLSLENAIVIPEEAVNKINNLITNVNIVLSQIIPGLTIGVKNLGSQVLQNGLIGYKIELMSNKNSKEIPLRYESEGIKKIISVLQLLIAVYNRPSITVAIDELDAGIFEYLLGELLKIISDKGKGQLIFTSHNLRPLETLNKGFIAFTTTNPSNRYIRLTNIKDNNNLRDFYFHDIILGEQNEELYAQTNNSEIAFAFREAGEICGS